MLSRCLQTGLQEQTSQALKVTEGEDWSLTDSSEDELREACDRTSLKGFHLNLHPAPFSLTLPQVLDLNPWGRVGLGH